MAKPRPSKTRVGDADRGVGAGSIGHRGVAAGGDNAGGGRQRTSASGGTPAGGADHETPAHRDRGRPWAKAAALVFVLVLVLGSAYAIGRRGEPGGTSSGAVAGTAPSPAARSGTVPGTRGATAVLAERLRVDVLREHPHDPTAYTQGLVWQHGTLYESTGLEGYSTLREVDPVSGDVRRQIDMSPDVFAEGLALVGERLIQLTWQDEVAFVYDRATFDPLDDYVYQGEGWGLCYDGRRLVMSDGSSNLTFRDPVTFEPTGSVAVTLDGSPIIRLNELECVGADVYANVWLTDTILRIDPSDGTVRSVIDAAGLLSAEDIAAIPEPTLGAVLNGIAYDPARDVFLVTGKLWPKLFEVRFVSAGTPDPVPSPGPTLPPGTPTAARPDGAFLPHTLDRM